MPFNGSGTYTPPSAPDFPAVSGTTIVASQYNAVITDLATAFNNCLTRDGQGKPSAAIDWNAKALTNVGAFAAASASFTAALGVASGGTGLNSTPTNGQVLIGNGTNFALANITGDSNIQVTNGAGTIALSFIGGGGSVSSVNASTTLSGLSFSGGPITTSGTLALSGTLGIASGGTGQTTAGAALSALGGVAAGAITSSGLTMTTSRLLGRTTASTGAIEELTVGATLSLAAGVLAVVSVPQLATFDASGAGAVAGTAYNGASARTISYNTIGAMPDTQRVQAITSSATVTPAGATDDIVVITAQAVGLTMAAPSGSPWQGRGMVIRIKDNGTARAISWNAAYRAIGTTLPTTTIVNKTTYVGFIYNSTDSKWDCVAVTTEA